MHSGLLILVAIVMPIPTIILGIRKKEAPYVTCLGGIISAGIGMVFVFLLSDILGHNIVTEMIEVSNEMAKLLPESQGEILRAIYREATEAIPGTMMVLATLLSYFEYILLSNIIKVKGERGEKMPPFRELALPRNAINGWFIIFILAWLTKLSGLDFGTVVFLNVSLLFTFTFSLQGLAVALMWAHLRRIPKVVAWIVLILLWLTAIGKTILFVVGILESILLLRRRMGGKW